MKRSRAPNFTNAEIMHLLKLVEKYPVIENKKTDGATSKDKQMAWQSLSDEYNSQTNFSPRTAENLASCYKNQKIKVKKIYSTEKMAIRAPVLLNAMEEHGQNWDLIAQDTQSSSLDCQNAFEHLVKEAKQEEALYKKEINRTGGGPAPQPSSSAHIIEKVKTLIGPSLEGLYTEYDGDADFMKQQEASVSIDGCTPDQNLNLKRLNIMKKKVDPSLETLKKGNKKPNVCNKFSELADEKKALVKAQKILTDYQIQHQELLIELAKEKLQFEKERNEMELQFLQQKYELELDLIRNKK